MKIRPTGPLTTALLLGICLLTALALAPGRSAAQPAQADDPSAMCTDCHNDRDLAMTLAGGETLALFVDPAAHAASVHGGRVKCAECHPAQAEVPHPELKVKTVRDLRLATSEQCRRCHFTNYSQTLGGIHQPALARGDATAPVCIDCHGSHEIKTTQTPSADVRAACERCHGGVGRTFAHSVHGTNGKPPNPDLPTCVSCHRAHDIGGPRDPAWNPRTPDLCAQCHANPALAAKYGMSPRVVQTYLTDFHGMTASLSRTAPGMGEGRFVARCTDCHGVHDITKTDAPGSRVMKANLVKTCQQCHADATENFPDAWLSHYEPSLAAFPLVWLVQIGYAILIPFMVGGLGLQILLHLWRVVVNR
ncbi:MAG TPA: cytochrome c3 family protein [Vicinamibacterales bacterium]|jgi:predicted CXXCH cytochrome family protein|nr:cytochrome c3 family protein [Vicinamibacterales bacterium]